MGTEDIVATFMEIRSGITETLLLLLSSHIMILIMGETNVHNNSHSIHGVVVVMAMGHKILCFDPINVEGAKQAVIWKQQQT